MRRHKRFGLFLVIFFAISAATSLAADSPSTERIKKALSVLKDLKTHLKAKNDKNKVEAAIQELENFIREDAKENEAAAEAAAAAAVAEKVSIPDFIDFTEKYKGRMIGSLELIVDSPIFADDNMSLQLYVGGKVNFRAYGPKGSTLNVTISIPKNLSVPKAVSGDKLIVTFKCTQGDLRQGNVAVEIKRP